MKQAPNDRCNCNSGKKYKKCCGPRVPEPKDARTEVVPHVRSDFPPPAGNMVRTSTGEWEDMPATRNRFGWKQ